MTKFEIIGENLHCSRALKFDNPKITEDAGGGKKLEYVGIDGAKKFMTLAPCYLKKLQSENAKSFRPVISALLGAEKGAVDSLAFLRNTAQSQLNHGADFLDLNVDDISTKPEEQIKYMERLIEIVDYSEGLPLSLDSSSMDVLSAGLEVAKHFKSAVLINSLSLKNQDFFEIAARNRCQVIASAMGEEVLTQDIEKRFANLVNIHTILKEIGMPDEAIRFDPLVFPLSVQPDSATGYFKLAELLKSKFPKTRISAGLSNISFGLPMRRLINLVFLREAVKKGCNSAIINPLSVNLDFVKKLDPQGVAEKAALALINEEDQFALEFVSNYHEGVFAEWKI